MNKNLFLTASMLVNFINHKHLIIDEFKEKLLNIKKNQSEGSHSLTSLYIGPFIEIKDLFVKQYIKSKNKIKVIFLKRRVLNDN